MKKQVILLALPISIILSGCSKADAYFEKKIFEQSKIQEDSDYQKSQKYLESGELDQQGYYIEENLEKEQLGEDMALNTAHIVFAKNNYLDVSYFSDADFKIELNTNICNLAVGDKIYARAAVNQTATSSMYAFGGFYIYQYHEGNSERIMEIQASEDGFVLEILPENIGTDLSVEPIGVYKKRNLSLRDYYRDEEEEEHDLSGKWWIDNSETTDDRIEINSVSSYTVSYEYDSNEYFYVDSNPEAFFCNDDDGIVIFPQKEALDETENYSVELHKYVTASITSNEQRNVSVNNAKEEKLKAGDILPIPKLKYGDNIIIETDKKWSELENSKELVALSEEIINGKYKYTVTVPQKGGEFAFNPANYKYEHGTVTFKCFGKEVTTTQYLAKGHKIVYEGNPDKGWQLNDQNKYIIVSDEEETKRQLNSIRFVESVLVDVTLEQPEVGGKITYIVDDRELTAGTYKLLCGTPIKMNFSPWEGWINNYKNGEIYTVTDKNAQTVAIQSKSVDEAFVEDDGHKPLLEVVLDKSVGENMQFEFAASGLDKGDYQYEKGWFRRNYTIIKPRKIGTEKGITISMSKRALQPNTAIKIAVEKEDINKNRYSEYLLVDELMEQLEPISIYKDEEMGKSELWYRSIKITVSVVDVLMCRIPESQINAELNLKVAQSMKVLEHGDILEGDEKVIVTITPQDGYYVSGKDIKNDIYQSTMKFSKYLSDIDQIIEKHPIIKYYQITLDEKDAYGKCVYSLDGKKMKELIYVKEGQKLVLEYEIDKPGYVIEDTKGFVFGIKKDRQKKKESLEITSSLDGKTINRDTFGIHVIKEE